jgi:DNA (cytosine-5)-methyltransferase 1
MLMTAARESDASFTDMFCGAGGSSIGLREAGFTLVLGANHWQTAIDTHSANFTDAEHICEDINKYDMRRLPWTRILWASIICTEGSPAGGKRKKRGGDGGQMSLIEESGHVSEAGWERTRATAYDVIRATEVRKYDVVIVENVVEFETDWPLFWWWLEGMVTLGYQYQVVCVNSAHVGGEDNPFAPQWRDRIYIVFTRKGMRLPDLEPRPLAWCFSCDEIVAARQTWKDHTPLGRRKIGKYREQYGYTCPNTTRRHDSFLVEPFVLPAAAAIDWSNLGTRIGDRKRTPAKPEGLAPATIARIRAGLAMFAEPVIARANGQDPEGSAYLRAWPASGSPLGTVTTTRDEGVATAPFLTLLRSGRVRTTGVDEPLAAIMASGSNHGLVLPVGGNNHDGPARSSAEPMAARMVRDTDALVTSPFITMLRGPANAPSGIGEPLATMTTGRNHGLTVPPFIVKNYGGNCQPANNVDSVGGPLSAVTVRDGHALVIPFRGRRSRPTTTGQPLHTMATRESAGLLQPDDIDIAECRFRMLQPREHLRAQRFPDDYIVTGNQGEQTAQAGGAVSANVAHWIGNQVAKVL